MATKQDFTFESRDGITQIHAVKWMPDHLLNGRPKAVVQIVHGMAEYIDRYDAFARFLADKGFVVTGSDHLGHGQSIAKDSCTGYFCKDDPATVVVRDVHRLTKTVRGDYPLTPYILFGHSMGSFIVRDYLTRYGTGIDGAIIQGTGYQPASLAKTGLAVAKVQRLFLGEKHRSGLLNAMSFGSYLKKIHPVRTKMDWLSFNTENVDAYNADPMLGFTFTINGFQTLLNLVLRSGDINRMREIPKDLPVLFTAGEEDPVGDYGKAVERLYGIYKDTLQLRDVELRLFPHMRHEILMEDDRETVYEEYLRWIGEHWKDM